MKSAYYFFVLLEWATVKARAFSNTLMPLSLEDLELSNNCINAHMQTNH